MRYIVVRRRRGYAFRFDDANPLVPYVRAVLAALDRAMPQWRIRDITVGRDFIGISHEAELFEGLINRASVTEPELQAFFEEHPHFLTSGMSKAIAHPTFPLEDRKSLVPDFLLEPFVAQRRARLGVADSRPQAAPRAPRRRARTP